MPIKSGREGDEMALMILHLRRHMMPSRVARELNITADEVRKVCKDVKNADIACSTKRKMEELYNIVLHYPHL